jgi:hypothetical protein
MEQLPKVVDLGSRFDDLLAPWMFGRSQPVSMAIATPLRAQQPAGLT